MTPELKHSVVSIAIISCDVFIFNKASTRFVFKENSPPFSVANRLVTIHNAETTVTDASVYGTAFFLNKRNIYTQLVVHLYKST